MKSSIRKFLLIYLLLAIAVTTTLTALGNYYFDQKDIQKHFNRITAACPSSNIPVEDNFELGKQIARNDLYIMFWTFPLSGLLIWIIIGRGLRIFKQVAKEVANRAPSHLEPVNIKHLPEEIKPVIDELNKLFKRLKEGFEREKRFAADAAHELRTPLAAIKAQVQVALNTNNLEEKDIALQKLLASVNRSTHTVQQLLTLSKLAPDEANINELGKVNLITTAREVLALLAPAAIEKQIEIEFEFPESIQYFSGNSMAISILIRNLVDNAIRYCKKGGIVNVNVYEQRNEIVLEVIDNGPGIPREYHKRVFERFFRVLGNKSPGSGLGLAIVQQIVDFHHGRIVLKSPKKGKGLIVKVIFPLKT